MAMSFFCAMLVCLMQEQPVGKTEPSSDEGNPAHRSQVCLDQVIPRVLGSILWVLKGMLSPGGFLVECAHPWGPRAEQECPLHHWSRARTVWDDFQ